MADSKQLISDKYREVLCSSPLGREVLADILKTCHLGITLDPDNIVQISEYNVGVVILAKCGVFKKDNFEDVIRALCSVSLPLVK